jgi:hypothetical protein
MKGFSDADQCLSLCTCDCAIKSPRIILRLISMFRGQILSSSLVSAVYLVSRHSSVCGSVDGGDQQCGATAKQ